MSLVMQFRWTSWFYTASSHVWSMFSRSVTVGICQMNNIGDLRNNAKILCKDFETVTKLLSVLADSGKEHLQVIADFDRTLSKAYLEDGTVCSGSHDVFAKAGPLSNCAKNGIKDLYNKYYPIEIDPHKSTEEKLPAMISWWTEVHNILVKSKLHRNAVKECVSQANITLRDRCDDFFLKLNKSAVPCLIFSAGVGDVIEEVIHQQAHFYENVKVVSNYMDFDEKGVICGFKGELIHVFNKNEAALSKSHYFEMLRHRDNILLFGDSLGDVAMANGVANCQNILKIGFLNDKNPHRKAAFLEAFDIVIDNDQTMDIPNLILENILSNKSEFLKLSC